LPLILIVTFINEASISLRRAIEELLPVEALMNEHRLIERMIPLIRKELLKMEATTAVNSKFVEIIVDFIRIYADRCHHGKEEGILFRQLSNKPISTEHATMMRELIEEHVYARKTTSNLEKANLRYVNGDVAAREDVGKLLNDLAEFYTKHIQKEDTQFFYPSMEYFSPQEQELMLQEFWAFDRKIVHEKYARVLDELESSASVQH
jgi:hemerythrin-like domain-containing protein